MKKTLSLLSVLLLLGIAVYFVNSARPSGSSYDFGFAIGHALGETLTSPLVWLMAAASLVLWLVSRRLA